MTQYTIINYYTSGLIPNKIPVYIIRGLELLTLLIDKDPEKPKNKFQIMTIDVRFEKSAFSIYSTWLVILYPKLYRGEKIRYGFQKKIEPSQIEYKPWWMVRRNLKISLRKRFGNYRMQIPIISATNILRFSSYSNDILTGSGRVHVQGGR